MLNIAPTEKVYAQANSERGWRVKFNAFSCGRGYILSLPENFAPLDSEGLCGAVSALLGTVDSARLPTALNASISADIESHAYALVTPDVARAVHMAEIIESAFLASE